MGLYSVAEKKRDSPPTTQTTQGYDKKDDPIRVSTDAIAVHMSEQIEREKAKVPEPTATVGQPTGRLQIQRPGGTHGIDMRSIKQSLQKKLHKEEGEEEGPPPEELSGPRVSTGVKGLNEVMEGGLRPLSISLIGGGAGSGKSIFSSQFLIDGIDHHNENGVYITFEQTPNELFADLDRFGWDLQKKVEEKKLAVMHYTPEQVEKVLEAGGGTVRDTIESIGAKRLVIDSLTAFALLHVDELEQRRAAFDLFDAIKRWGCTALVISEQEPDPEKHVSTTMEFQVDGVILLYNIRKGDIRERSLEIFKMRGVRHARKIFPMKITSKGMQIYPEETVF